MSFIQHLFSDARLKSLLWRSAMMGLAALLAALGTGVGDLSLPPAVVAVMGLVLGEISKAINNHYSEK